MTRRLYKILEIIGILIIFLIAYKLFPFIKLFLDFISKIIMPFFLGFIIAFIFEPFIMFLENKKINRKFAIVILVFIFLGIGFLIFKFAFPLFIKELKMFLEMIPNYLNTFKTIVEKISTKFQKLPVDFQINYDKIEAIVIEKITTMMIKISNNIQGSFSYIFQLLITPIIAIYFLCDYPKIEDKIKNILKSKNKNILYEALSKIKQSLRKYLKGVIIVMVILSIATTFCFLVAGIDYALLFGIIIGVTDIIPYIGPYIGGAIAVIFTIVTRPERALIVLIIIISLQFLESNFLVPKVQSKTMKTHPLLVLLSVAFFGELLGILGMVIAVPLEKIIEIIIMSLKEYKKEKLKKEDIIK